MQIIDGNQIAQKVYSDLSTRVERLKNSGKTVSLAVFFDPNNPASLSYINKKTRAAEKLGIKILRYEFSQDSDYNELEKQLKNVAEQTQVDGILVQLPLPGGIDRKLLDLIPAKIDVDGIGSANLQPLLRGEFDKVLFLPPAANAILHILESAKVELHNKNILIVGTGELVGKPLAAIMLKKNYHFKLANQYTENIDELLADADVIISAVGKPGIIKAHSLKQDTVVIDAGTAGTESGSVVGDVDPENLETKASLACLVPGGVGPVTVAKLLENVLISAELRAKS